MARRWNSGSEEPNAKEPWGWSCSRPQFPKNILCRHLLNSFRALRNMGGIRDVNRTLKAGRSDSQKSSHLGGGVGWGPINSFCLIRSQFQREDFHAPGLGIKGLLMGNQWRTRLLRDSGLKNSKKGSISDSTSRPL